MLRLVLSQPLHSASPQRSSAPFNLLFPLVSDLFGSPGSLRSLSKEYTRPLTIVLKKRKKPKLRGFPHGDFPSTHFPLSLSHNLGLVTARCRQGDLSVWLNTEKHIPPTVHKGASLRETDRSRHILFHESLRNISLACNETSLSKWVRKTREKFYTLS